MLPAHLLPCTLIECLQGEFSDCAKGHVAYKPKMGDALLFFDKMPDYLEDVSGTRMSAYPHMHS